MCSTQRSTLVHPLFFPQVKTVIFDKTGTLSHGKPVVTKVVLFTSESVCPYQLFTAIVGLSEANSEHPLGKAVTNFVETVRRTTVNPAVCIMVTV